MLGCGYYLRILYWEDKLMANTFLEFLQEMEEEQKQQMHREWIKAKNNQRLNKKLDEIVNNLREDVKDENK
jgi:ribonuclease HI